MRFLPTTMLMLAVIFFSAPEIHAQEAPADAPQSAAQANAALPEKILTNFVETGGSYRDLSNGYGHWAGGYARGVVVVGQDTVNAEVNEQYEFGDTGAYIAAGDTHVFNSGWYGSLTLGSSIGGFFWPRFRSDGFINRKWSERKQFVTTLGVSYIMAKDVHRDTGLFLGGAYYFQKPWLLEGGVRLNLSNPGEVFSPFGFVAVTQGRNKHHYVSLNVGAGQEGYQIIGPTTVLTSFASQTVTLTWRQWLGNKWGVNVVADYYHNPFYQRNGGVIGVFREF
jgi:YaiO family outer membrane protein